MYDMISTRGQRQGSIHQVLPILILWVLFAMLTFGERQLYLTFDEPSHLTAGYTFLAQLVTGEPDPTWTVTMRGHPLLVDAWEALPLYLGTPNIPITSMDGWKQDYPTYARSVAPILADPVERAAVAGRTPAILLVILLAAVVYRWGRDMWGEWGGLLALGTLAFDPNLLAHGRLATNDVGVTTLGTWGLYLVWRWERRPTWRRALAAGLVLGMTSVAKSSGIFWVAIGVGWAGITWWLNQRRVPGGLQVILMGGAAFVILWAMYGFAIGPLPAGPAIPVPAPHHWQGVLQHATPENKPWVIALGELHHAPWPWYFPLAFLIKNPLPLLFTIPLAAAALGRKRLWAQLKLLIVFAILYLTLAIVRGPNLGYRHILPIHPLIHLLLAGGVVTIWEHLHTGQHRWRWAAIALAGFGVWYIVGTLRIYPFELSFFNELIGGPDQGWRYLEGSNTDWGQGWAALRKFRDERGVTFSYSGTDGYATVVPHDLWERPLPPLQLGSDPLFRPWLFPAPGDYVISANSFTGFPLVNRDNFAWFRYHPPDAVIAHSLYYYHVEVSEAPRWLAQCTIPAPPLSAEDIQEGFGEIPLRRVPFDCTQSWVYPGGGAAQGVYALHGDLLRPESLWERLYLAPARPNDDFIARHVDGLPLAFRQWEPQTQPAFVLFERASGPLSLLETTTVHVAPADAPPAALPTGPDVDGIGRNEVAGAYPGEPLVLLGVVTIEGEQEWEIETWWQVVEGPVERPFSLMAHLITDEGTVLAIADGLGISPLVITAGDVLVQRHRFPVPPAGASIWLRTGGYWLDTGELWATEATPEANALFVPLRRLSRPSRPSRPR